MKTMLLIAAAASMMGGETVSAVEACAVPAGAAAKTAGTTPRFDPMVIDLQGDKKLAPGSCSHAISTKGTGTSGRTAGVDMAINMKGTGANSGRAAVAGPGGTDCDDSDPSAARCNEGSAVSDNSESCGDAKVAIRYRAKRMEVTCDITKAAGRTAGYGDEDCDGAGDEDMSAAPAGAAKDRLKVKVDPNGEEYFARGTAVAIKCKEAGAQ